MSHAADDTWTLLGRVGLTRAGGPLDALADPAATDALAALLAERLRPCEPDVIVVWEGLQSVVLGYAVGLRLGVPVAVLSDDEGLVRCATPIIADTRAALVAATTPDPSLARMAASYLEAQDAELVVTGTLVARPGRADGTVALAELPPDEPASGTLSRRDVSPAPGQPPRQDRR
jgi:hypothetical protein